MYVSILCQTARMRQLGADVSWDGPGWLGAIMSQEPVRTCSNCESSKVERRKGRVWKIVSLLNVLNAAHEKLFKPLIEWVSQFIA